jgi:hypothetical protein
MNSGDVPRVSKVVDGLRYDTEKADLVACDREAGRCLYLTQKGRYFIVHSSGTRPSVTAETEGAAFLMCTAAGTRWKLLTDWEIAFPDRDFEDA